jgi:hypothetical protein
MRQLSAVQTSNLFAGSPHFVQIRANAADNRLFAAFGCRMGELQQDERRKHGPMVVGAGSVGSDDGITRRTSNPHARTALYAQIMLMSMRQTHCSTLDLLVYGVDTSLHPQLPPQLRPPPGSSPARALAIPARNATIAPVEGNVLTYVTSVRKLPRRTRIRKWWLRIRAKIRRLSDNLRRKY